MNTLLAAQCPQVPLFGTVQHFDPVSGCGRIDTPVGRHVGFHKSVLCGCDFEELWPGCPVRLELAEAADDGPVARTVLLLKHPNGGEAGCAPNGQYSAEI